MSQLKVAAVQYPLAEGVTPAAFFAKVALFIREAKAHGADLVLFPELITTELVDWSQPELPQVQAIAKDFVSGYTAFLQSEAKAQNISILGGTTPRLTPDGITNTALLAFPNGRVLMQDKLFLTPDEKAWGFVGGTVLNIFETPWGKTVVSICFDTEFPQVSQLLAAERPDVILVPSWTSTHSGLNRVDYTSRARAIEHFAYVVKTGTVPGDNATQPHFGQASIHTPQEAGFPTTPSEGLMNKAQTLYGTLDLGLLRERKSESGFYPSNEQSLREQKNLPSIKIERN